MKELTYISVSVQWPYLLEVLTLQIVVLLVEEREAMGTIEKDKTANIYQFVKDSYT